MEMMYLFCLCVSPYVCVCVGFEAGGGFNFLSCQLSVTVVSASVPPGFFLELTTSVFFGGLEKDCCRSRVGCCHGSSAEPGVKFSLKQNFFPSASARWVHCSLCPFTMNAHLTSIHKGMYVSARTLSNGQSKVKTLQQSRTGLTITSSDFSDL